MNGWTRFVVALVAAVCVACTAERSSTAEPSSSSPATEVPAVTVAPTATLVPAPTATVVPAPTDGCPPSLAPQPSHEPCPQVGSETMLLKRLFEITGDRCSVTGTSTGGYIGMDWDAYIAENGGPGNFDPVGHAYFGSLDEAIDAFGVEEIVVDHRPEVAWVIRYEEDSPQGLQLFTHLREGSQPVTIVNLLVHMCDAPSMDITVGASQTP